MSYNLTTFSKFYYGIEVIDGYNIIDFNDGFSDKTATIPAGGYSLNGLALEIAKQMNKTAQNAGFTIEVDRDTRKYTIKTTDLSNFSLLFLTGTNSLLSIYALIGFTNVDYTGAGQYSGVSSIGKVYYPQFMLGNYVDADLTSRPVDAVVNRSTSGNKYEVVKFGSDKVYKFEILYTTNLNLSGATYFKYNATGIEDLLDFMNFCILKFPLEFMKDETNSSLYSTVVLESTPQSSDGVAYEISPDYGQSLPEFYTLGGELQFRRL